MMQVEAYARDLGLDRLEVNAAQDAEGFYQKLGWTTVRSDWKNPLMAKALDAGGIAS